MLSDGVLLLPTRRRECPGGQSLWCPPNFAARSERTPATRTFCWPRKKVTSERGPNTHVWVCPRRDSSVRARTQGMSGLSCDCTEPPDPLSWPKRGAPPCNRNLSPYRVRCAARPPALRAHPPSNADSGSFSLVTFSLSQQRESDCPPGHPRRRLGTRRRNTPR